MFCRNCGNSIPEGAATCEKCGAVVNQSQPIREQSANSNAAQNQNQQQSQQQSQQQNQYRPQAVQYTPQNQGYNYNQQTGGYGYYQPKPQPMSVGGYIGRSLLTLIPFVGGLIYFIMLFVWGGDTTKEESFRNWAKAELWMMLIGVVISVIAFIIIFAVMAASGTGIFYNYSY